MNLDELQSVRDRERQTDKLQQLRESFYADAGALIQQLRDERERAGERAENPYDDPEVRQLSDEISTAKQTVEAIYEKRVGKLVKAASFAAADLPAEADGMTAEEQDLFETLVEDIKDNREHVLDVIDGDVPTPTTETETTAKPEQGAAEQPPATPAGGTEQREDTASASGDGVSAANAMGASGQSPSASASGDRGEPPGGNRTPPQTGAGGADEPVESDPHGEDQSQTLGEDQSQTHQQTEPRESPPVRKDGGTVTETAADGTEPATSRGEQTRVERETVRITEDVQPFVGYDDREYDLSTNDVVQLPATNVAPLLEQGVAEEFE